MTDKAQTAIENASLLLVVRLSGPDSSPRRGLSITRLIYCFDCPHLRVRSVGPTLLLVKELAAVTWSASELFLLVIQSLAIADPRVHYRCVFCWYLICGLQNVAYTV